MVKFSQSRQNSKQMTSINLENDHLGDSTSSTLKDETEAANCGTRWLKLKGAQKNQAPNKITITSHSPSLKVGDKIEELSQDDVIIAVMGPTGSGKSTFINTIANSDMAVGHKLVSCTSEINTVKLTFPDLVNSPIVFVDTPGFDHTDKTDIEILKMVADWLKATYEKRILLSGLLYCHRISNTQMAATSLKHLRIFEELCGKNALQNVVLVTTMWDEVDEEAGKSAEEEIKTKYWSTMLERGSTASRFMGTRESAIGLLIPLIDKRNSLLLQQEMVDMGRKLAETSAGRYLFARAEYIVCQRQEVIERIRTEMERPIGDTLSLKPPHDERMEQTIEEMRKLDLAAGRRFLEMSERWFNRNLLVLKLKSLMRMTKPQAEAVNGMAGKVSGGSKRTINETPDEVLVPTETAAVFSEAISPGSRRSFKEDPGQTNELVGEDQTEGACSCRSMGSVRNCR